MAYLKTESTHCRYWNNGGEGEGKTIAERRQKCCHTNSLQTLSS